jgi:hypothetical protein
MKHLVIYWDDFPPENVKILKHTKAGVKYEQIPTELFVIDINDKKELDNSNIILIPYNNENYIYMIVEYEHNRESPIKEILNILNQKYKIYNDDRINIILSNEKITKIDKYNFKEDDLNINGKLLESDDLQGDMKEAYFNIEYE